MVSSSIIYCRSIFLILKNNIRSTYTKNIIILILFVIPLFFNQDSNIFFIVFCRSFIALGFVTIGYYSFKYINLKEISILSIILIFVLNILLSKINGFVDLHYLIFNNYILYIINSIIGSIAVIMIMKKLKSKLLYFYGINSLIIMGTQGELIRITIRIAKKMIIGIELNNLLQGSILFLLIMILEIPIILFINNYFSFILGKQTKVLNLVHKCTRRNTKNIK